LEEIKMEERGSTMRPGLADARAFVRALLKAVAAAITLGTGNSLGPEGPSVEIGASIANGVGTVLNNSRERKLSLVAAGSAAGISSGFNAAVAGCFFALESVLRSSTTDAVPSLTTAMLLLSSVLASVVSQAGLGSDPAFKIPAYDFRSPAELPLYLLLGILSGGVSVALVKGSAYATAMFDHVKKTTGIPAGLLPPVGGLAVGLIALAYPEILYWGFENVDVLLESQRPWVRAPPVDLLLQLVAAKLVATSLCRGSGLVGGVYAPSLFMGAALGSAYGSLAGAVIANADPMYHLDALKVAAPQAYALVIKQVLHNS
jgi:H+/Cl- antiporter ClcA